MVRRGRLDLKVKQYVGSMFTRKLPGIYRSANNPKYAEIGYTYFFPNRPTDKEEVRRIRKN